MKKKMHEQHKAMKDMELIVEKLKEEWSSSKEAVWRLEVSSDIIDRCKRELKDMSDKIDRMCMKKDHELSLQECLQVTKQANVLIRVVNKLITASKEQEDKKSLVVTLDREEYRMFVTRFLEYM